MNPLLAFAIGALTGAIVTMLLVFAAVACLDNYFDYR